MLPTLELPPTRLAYSLLLGPRLSRLLNNYGPSLINSLSSLQPLPYTGHFCLLSIDCSL
jgi:hypothetical protein